VEYAIHTANLQLRSCLIGVEMFLYSKTRLLIFTSLWYMCNRVVLIQPEMEIISFHCILHLSFDPL
jgi:hypothetical protein